MYDLVTIGDITVDLFFRGEELTHKDGRLQLAIGGKYYTDFFHQGLGGSGGNVAVHGASLGLQTAVVAKVGEGALKNVIVQGLVRKTVSTEFIYFEREYTSISVILLMKSGERTIIKHSDRKGHLVINPSAEERIQKSSIIFLGNLPDVPIAERASLLGKLKTAENLVAVNFGSKDCKNGIKYLAPLLTHADILFLNRYELGDLIGVKGEKLNLKKNLKEKIKLLHTILVVTDGKNGSFAYTEGEVYYQEAAKAEKIVDTTGAGDAFTGAFLAKYKETTNIQKAIEAGSIHAAGILSKVGAN